jgi:hypothetical protein
MAFETELQNLKDKKEYWKDVNRLNFFYGCECPNEKWTSVWEDTPEGLYVLCETYTHNEVTLYGVDGKIYRIYNNFGKHDWEIFRELYVAGYESGSFRTEAPFYQQETLIDSEPWSFIITAPPTGEYGTNIWDTSIEHGYSDEFIDTLKAQAPIIDALKTITEKYNTGMTPKVFCAGNLFKNSSGYYWSFLTDYNYSYEKARRIGYAVAKHANSKKYTIIKKMLDINVSSNSITDTNVDHKATVMDIIEQFYNPTPESPQ